MRLMTDSDIFINYLNKADNVQSNIFKLLGNKSKAVILNEKLKDDIAIMAKIHKEVVVSQCIAAINSGDIIIVSIPMENNLPECIPFVKYKKGDKPKVIINVSRYVVETKNSEGEIDYKMEVQKLYCMCIPAYVTLKLLDQGTVLSPMALKTAALLWARMFNKVLIKTIGLTTNKERYEAFMYFGIRFFLKYYMNTPDVVVDSIAEGYLQNGKSVLIGIMESKIDEMQINPYESFSVFCKTLFNNEISNIKGIRINNVEENINMSFYIKKFIEMYNFGAIGSLISFPYFFYTVFCGYYMCNIMNDRAMEDVVQYDKKDVPKFLSSIIKDIH